MPGTWISKISGLAKSALPVAATDGHSTDIITDLYGRLILSVTDMVSNALRIMEVDPISTHYIEETLLDETGILANTTDYAYFDMDGFSVFTIQGETNGVTPTDVLTVTVEASVEGGADRAACAYQDITNAAFNVASWVDTDFMAICNAPVAFKYVRVKYNTSNTGGDDCDLTLYMKKLY